LIAHQQKRDRHMKMSGEASFTNAVSFQHQSNTSSVGQIDYMKLLNNLFQHDINTPSKTVDAIFEQFEKTFRELITVLF
jgi:hypothetical protein